MLNHRYHCYIYFIFILFILFITGMLCEILIRYPQYICGYKIDDNIDDKIKSNVEQKLI